MASSNTTHVSWISPDYPQDTYDGPPRNVAYIEHLNFDPSLQPKHYEISGTNSRSRILILDVEILEATGQPPYRGDVLIIGAPPILPFCFLLEILIVRKYQVKGLHM